MQHPFPIIRLSISVCLALAALVTVPASPVLAVPTNRYVATTGSDASNDCTNGLSPCLTITHAIGESSSGDSIYVGAGTFVDNIYVGIDLSIIGAGPLLTTLDGSGAAARTVAVAAAVTATLAGMTIRGGNTGSSGGGVENSGILTLTEITITGNTAQSGGGVANYGTMNVENAEISWNDATSGSGGGIMYNAATTNSLKNVTLTGNDSPSGVGGVHVQANAIVNMTNVTISGNSGAGSSASGIVVVAGSTANLLSSTITNNTGPTTGIAGYGTLTFQNTIVADNTTTNCFIGGGSTWTSLGNNLENTNTCGFVGVGDLPSTPALLAGLGDYGGPIPTRTLLTGSLAIDAGANTGWPATDARGYPRSVDGNNNAVAVTDIGAVEMKEETTTFTTWQQGPNPSNIELIVAADAALIGSLTLPTGTVEVVSDGTSCNITLSSGSGSCYLAFETPGPHGVSYRYTGDSTHDMSIAVRLQMVKPVVAADFDGSYTSDVYLYRSGAWLEYDFTTATPLPGTWTGIPGGSCIPAPMDYNGDATVDFTQLCGGAWNFYNAAGGFVKGIWVGNVAGQRPVPADYDGNGTDDVMLFRGGAWLAYDYASGAYLPGSSLWTGMPGGAGIPAPMDYDGNGAAYPTFLSTSGAWHFYNHDGSYNKGIWIGAIAGQLPVPGDYDNDGIEDVWVFRAGAWLPYDFNTGAYLAGSAVWTGAPAPPAGGGATKPAPIDYDGDGTLDFTVFAGGPWHFYNHAGAYVKGIWVGKNTADVPISRRMLP